MIHVKREGVLLEKTSLEFENDGVLNPAVIAEGNEVHMFYRAVQKGNYSTLGYCRFDGPLHLAERCDHPFFCPEQPYESHGVEDARIVKIDGTYYLTYTAYDGANALGALATSTDLVHFARKGLIVPQFTFEKFKELTEHLGQEMDTYYTWNVRCYETEGQKKTFIWDKNVVFFPRKINGKFYFMKRVKPQIQMVSVESLDDLTEEFWEDYFRHFTDHILFIPKFNHETCYIGAGCPPIETPEGWIIIYHSVECFPEGNSYSACAALLDLDNPQKELARLPYPLFRPKMDYELSGVVDHVCFPTGIVKQDDTLYIYYGAADERIACASVSLNELMRELMKYK